MAAALKTGNNPDYTIEVIEGADHSLGVYRDVPIHQFKGVGNEGLGIVHDWCQTRFCQNP